MPSSFSLEKFQDKSLIFRTMKVFQPELLRRETNIKFTSTSPLSPPPPLHLPPTSLKWVGVTFKLPRATEGIYDQKFIKQRRRKRRNDKLRQVERPSNTQPCWRRAERRRSCVRKLRNVSSRGVSKCIIIGPLYQVEKGVTLRIDKCSEEW